MRILELYAGIGGMHYALKESGINGSIVAAIEISTIANEVYKYNFPSTNLLNRNIESLTVNEIEMMNIDTIFMSPPCQPFTKNGLQKDKNDTRTSSFFHILELIPKLSNLLYIILENVEPFQRSNSHDSLISCLNNSNFNYKEFILTPCHLNIPNNRSRYFLIAKKNTMPFCLSHIKELCINSEKIIDILSKLHLYKAITSNYIGDLSIECPTLGKFIDIHLNDNDNLYENYLLPMPLLEKYLKVLDIRNFESDRSCCFTSAYGRYAEGTGSVFSPLKKFDIDDKLNALMNINCNYQSDEWNKLAKSLELRYFTPREISKLMCFPDNFSFPNSISKRQKYKLIGNSINVRIVSHLILLLNYNIPNDTFNNTNSNLL